MPLSQVATTDRVITLVTAALQSGSIKLLGASTGGNKDSSKANAEADAAYLTTLLEKLADTVKTLGA